jgi:RNA polymerase sigma factor (sigma-70 family)
LTNEELLEKTLIATRMFWARHHRLLRGRLEFDDILQTARLAALQARVRYRRSEGVMEWTYLERRVRGALIDILRSDRWVPIRSPLMVEFDERDAPSYPPDPMRTHWLQHLIDTHCSHREASAIRNHYLYGIEQKEIARWWDRHPTDVFYHIKRGLAKLREAFTNNRRTD